MTAVPNPAPQPGSKPSLILEAARRLFLEHGYGAVSMDTVAREAGVSKATLYAHFRAKDLLFAAIVARHCGERLGGLPAAETGAGDVRATLAAVGRRFLDLLLCPDALAGYRMVIAESQRFPELAHAFFQAGPEAALSGVAAMLADFDRAGRLAVPDPRLAAEQFVGMVKMPLMLPLLLGVREPPTSEEIDRIVAAAVEAFARAYAPSV